MNLNYYYAYVERISEKDSFYLMTDDLKKLVVATREDEAKIAFRKAFPGRIGVHGGVVDISDLVQAGIIPENKLEILELIVKRKSS